MNHIHVILRVTHEFLSACQKMSNDFSFFLNTSERAAALKGENVSSELGARRRERALAYFDAEQKG